MYCGNYVKFVKYQWKLSVHVLWLLFGNLLLDISISIMISLPLANVCWGLVCRSVWTPSSSWPGFPPSLRLSCVPAGVSPDTRVCTFVGKLYYTLEFSSLSFWYDLAQPGLSLFISRVYSERLSDMYPAADTAPTNGSPCPQNVHKLLGLSMAVAANSHIPRQGPGPINIWLLQLQKYRRLFSNSTNDFRRL